MDKQTGAATQHETVMDDDDIAAQTMRLQEQKTTHFMIFFSLYIALAGFIYNFDLGYGGIVLIMKPFNEDFGVCKMTETAGGAVATKCSMTALQQSLVSLTFLFVALGGGLSVLFGNYLGRRGTIQVGCVFVAAGAGGMLGTSGNYAAYISCKCLGGVGLGLFIAGVPAYGVECTSPSKRGMLTSLFNIGFGVGNAVAAAVCLSTSKYTTSLAWKTPIICQLPLALILGVGVMIFPESPRWLLTKGKTEAARKSFARFYSLNPSDMVVSRQIQEVSRHIELERTMGSETSWMEAFQSTNRRRTLISVLVVIGQAISGGKFISTYASVFLAAVGIGSPFVITVTVASCAVIGGLISPFIVEYIGRRFSLLVGYTAMAALMLIIAAVATALGSTDSTAKNVLVVLLCLWTVIYGGFIGTSTSTIAPEMHSVRLRTYGQAVAVTAFETFSFGAAFYTPYMLGAEYGNMGMNVGYFYFGVTFVLLIMVFAWVPETARLTLEQIDDHFLSGRKAWKTSIGRNKKIAERQELELPSSKDC